AGIHVFKIIWTPAFAGVTSGNTPLLLANTLIAGGRVNRVSNTRQPRVQRGIDVVTSDEMTKQASRGSVIWVSGIVRSRRLIGADPCVCPDLGAHTGLLT